MMTLHRMRDVRISTGSAFGRRAHRRVDLVRWAVAAFLGGIVLGTIAGAGWAHTPAASLGLGGVLLSWLMLSFGSERPGDG